MRWYSLSIFICCWTTTFVFAEDSTTSAIGSTTSAIESNNSTKKAKVTRVKTTTLHWQDKLTKVINEHKQRLSSLWPPTNHTIFHNILNKEIPVQYIYEDDQCVAFYDAVPQAPIHVLVLPRKFYRMLSEVPDEEEPLLGHLLMVAKRVAKQLGLLHGYRIVINDGKDGFLPIKYLAVNVLGGRPMHWPPG